MREIVHSLKYRGLRVLASPLAAMMREAAGGLLEEADAVVPVPLTPWRRATRGFNQADDLARCLGPPVWRLLRRRQGAPQTGLPAHARRANVQGAFALRRRAGLAQPGGTGSLVRDRVLVVVDDVLTTGATVDDCSRVLLEAGARAVRALTAARAAAARPVPRPVSPRLSTARRR